MRLHGHDLGCCTTERGGGGGRLPFAVLSLAQLDNVRLYYNDRLYDARTRYAWLRVSRTRKGAIVLTTRHTKPCPTHRLASYRPLGVLSDILSMKF